MEFSFLGITLELTSVGLLLHQKTYTEAFLEEYKDVTPKRQRGTTREPEHFDKDAKTTAKSPPDMTNPHEEKTSEKDSKSPPKPDDKKMSPPPTEEDTSSS